MSGPNEHKYVTKEEFKSLHETVESLASSVKEINTTYSDKMDEMREANTNSISKLGDSLFERIHSVDNKHTQQNQERGKVPYPLLSLILGVILALASGLLAYIKKVETHSEGRIDKLIELNQNRMLLIHQYDREAVRERATQAEQIKSLQRETFSKPKTHNHE